MRKSTGFAVAVVVLVISAAGFLWFLFPFGRKAGTIENMRGSLLTYAVDHQGKFPIDSAGPYQALRKLYPEYCGADVLSGLSGNTERLKAALDDGRPLDGELTSWIYVQGLETNDSGSVAILWESKAGLLPSGKRSLNGSRPVLFLSGYITNIPLAEWYTFTNAQRMLLKELGVTNRAYLQQ